MTTQVGLARAVGQNWITPEQQAGELVESLVKEITGTWKSPGALPVREVAMIVIEYAALLRIVTDWGTALHLSNMLPDKVRPLPLNIHRELSDTNLLYLIRTGSLNLEARLNIYGQEHLNENRGENPYRFRGCRSIVRLEYGENQLDEYQWIIWREFSGEFLKKKPYKQQLEIVMNGELLARSAVHREIASLREDSERKDIPADPVWKLYLSRLGNFLMPKKVH